MSQPDLFTRLIRYFIGLGVGVFIGWFLAPILMPIEDSIDISLMIGYIFVLLFPGGLLAGIVSYPGDAKPFTRKLALLVFLSGLALSALMYFAGMGAFNEMDSADPLEGIGMLIIGMMLIVIAIVGVVATVVGAIVLIIGSILGEAIAKAVFYRGKSFDNFDSGSSFRYCKECGVEMGEFDRQCPSCGTQV